MGIISALTYLSLNESHFSVPPNHLLWIYHVPTCVNVNTDCVIPITQQLSRQKQLAKQSHAGICCCVTVSLAFVLHAKVLVFSSPDNTKQVRAIKERCLCICIFKKLCVSVLGRSDLQTHACIYPKMFFSFFLLCFYHLIKWFSLCVCLSMLWLAGVCDCVLMLSVIVCVTVDDSPYCKWIKGLH